MAAEAEAERVVEATREGEDEPVLAPDVKSALEIVRRHAANPEKIQKLRLEHEAVNEEIARIEARQYELRRARKFVKRDESVQITGDIDQLPPEIKKAVEIIRDHISNDEASCKVRAEAEALRNEVKELDNRLEELQTREGKLSGELEILEERAKLFDKIESGAD